jgi:hypothetical protein
VRLRKYLRLDVAILTVAVLARLVPGPRTVDDAYITFRYARNLLGGHGLVYNPGEAVLGTTTPLYAALLAFVGLFTGGSDAPFPAIAWLLNTLADIVVCWLIIRLGDRWGHRRVGLAAASIWAIAPWSVTFAIGGMETSVFVMLTIATFYCLSSDRPVAAALCGAASLLTRPDALLFLLPLALERLRRTMPKSRLNPDPAPIRTWEAAAFLAPILLWIGFGWTVYGSPLPNSMLAKSKAYLLPPEAGFIRLLQHYATPFLGHEIFGIVWIGVGLVLYPILFGLGAVDLVRRHNGAWPFFAAPSLYFTAFAVANPLLFRWYLTPPLPFLFVGIFLGIARIGRDVKRPILLPVLAAAAAISTLSAWTLLPDHGPRRPAPEMAYIKLELTYQEAARRLRDRLQDEDVLAAADIGALGYFTEAHVLDVLGLISPQSVAYYPLEPEILPPGMNYALPAELVIDLEPDVLVILEIYGRNTLLRNEAFLDRYQRIRTIPTDIYESKGMLIFERK